MKNLILVDFKIGVKEIIEKLRTDGAIEFDLVDISENEDHSEATVKNILDSYKQFHGVGEFVILTQNENRYCEGFPNNTIQFDGDVENLCKHITYVMTNFGREYKLSEKLFITSDTHFWHSNIIRYCNRPWSDVESMNKALIENWNSVVGENDKVIHLGDFCFGNKTKAESIIKQLHGKIDLVMGNHDRLKIQDYYNMGFHRVYDRPIVSHNFFILSHAPLQWIKEGDVYANIFGHVHDMKVYNTWTKNTCCACVERHNYTPILFDDIRRKFNELNETL